MKPLTNKAKQLAGRQPNHIAFSRKDIGNQALRGCLNELFRGRMLLIWIDLAAQSNR